MKHQSIGTLLPSGAVRWLLAVAFAILSALPSSASGTLPVAVSPGNSEGSPTVAEQCPTFLWGTVADAEWYELVVYQLPEPDQETSDVQERVVLRKKLPGSAHGWTPNLDQCLEAGVRYAWTVRAGGLETKTEWAEPTFFRVSDMPSAAEVQAAVEILKRYLAKGEPKTDTERLSQLPTKSTDQRSVVQETAKVLATAPAALHVESSAISGEVVGVRGVVNSSGGAAGVFNNTAGGMILSGLSSGSEVFSLNSSGTVTATSFSGNGSSLSNVTAADLSCTSCVGGTEIADNSVSSADIVNESISSSDIGPNAVGSSEVVDNSLTDADLAPGSVGSSEVADGSLTSADLGADSVGTSEIQTNAVGSLEVQDNSLTAADIGTDAVGSSEIADGSVTGTDIADGTIGSSDVNSSQVQLRVSGNCPSGQSIRVINSGGTVSCEIDTDTHVTSVGGLTGGNIVGSTSVSGLLTATNSIVASQDLGAGRHVEASSGHIKTGFPSISFSDLDIVSDDDLLADDVVFSRNGFITAFIGGSATLPGDGDGDTGDVNAADDLRAGDDVLALGTKSAIVKTAAHGSRRFYADESTEVFFFDRGRGQLDKGRVFIPLDPIFLSSVSISPIDPLLVQITLTSDCNGVFAERVDGGGFFVKEMGNGTSNATFNWEVAGKRRNYERTRLELVQSDSFQTTQIAKDGSAREE